MNKNFNKKPPKGGKYYGRSNKNKGNKRGGERNNFQDQFADREFEKGFNKGARSQGGPISVSGDTMNDPKWHTPSDQLLKDFASIPFSYVTGTQTQMQYSSLYKSPTTWTGQNFKIPGILAFTYFPTIGKCKAADDPFNQAMFNEYNWLRQATSGTSYYQAADLGIVQLAIINLYMLYAELVRVYGVLSNFSALNYYMPQMMVEALGFDYASLSSNKANFRGIINLLCDSMSRICLPSDIKYLERQLTLLNHVYIDSENVKGQYYVFKCLQYYRFVEADQSAGVASTALLTPLVGTSAGKLINYNDVLDFIPRLLNPLINSTLAQKISAETLKALGSGKLYKTSQIAETYTVTPIYSKEIMMQIENMNIVGGLGTATGIVAQNLTDLQAGTYCQAAYTVDEGVLNIVTGFTTVSNSYELRSALFNRDNWILNFHNESVPPEDIMEATRLTAINFESVTEGSTSASNVVTLNEVPSEVVIRAEIWTLGYQNSLGNPTSTAFTTDIAMYTLQQSNMQLNMNGVRDCFNISGILSAFDWHPQVYYHVVTGTASNDAFEPYHVYSSLPILDFDNYTVIDNLTLQNLHQLSLRGLWKVRSLPIG